VARKTTRRTASLRDTIMSDAGDGPILGPDDSIPVLLSPGTTWQCKTGGKCLMPARCNIAAECLIPDPETLGAILDEAFARYATDTAYTSAPFIETYTGRAFWPLEPKVEDVTIIDIAHHLSNQCRYSGATENFYCPVMDEKILTADLKWVPAGDMKPGTGLVGFDEYPFDVGSCGDKRRRYRHSVVTAFSPVKRRVIRMEMADGSTVRAASDHPWLAMSAAHGRNQHWLTASEISNAVSAGQDRFLHQFIKPWTESTEREAGWLAGVYDGEGTLVTGRGIKLSVAQNPGAVLQRIEEALKQFGFDYHIAGKNSKCKQINLRGGWQEAARLLGAFRPTRLLKKFEAALISGAFTTQFEGREDPLRVVKCFEEDEEWCAGIETSTKTYLCGGYGAHNSTAQHCCLLENYVAKKKASVLDRLQILMHDSAETYLVDIPRPVKQFMPEYRKWDYRITTVVREWLGLSGVPVPSWQDEYDSRICVDEHEQVTSNSLDWGDDWKKPLGITISPWSPRVAEQQFLMRYADLMLKLTGQHQYLRSGWGIPTHAMFQEFPFKSESSDVLDGPVDEHVVTDLIEVDVRGHVGRVKLRSPNGMMIRDTRAGSYPRPAWKWIHGRFELLTPTSDLPILETMSPT
jgi:hypothetical protein